MFTARYGLSPDIKQSLSASKGLNLSCVQVSALADGDEIGLMNQENMWVPSN